MAAEVVLAVVETDLRLLAAEAKKAEGPMTNLMGMLHHSELPAVKDATERALHKIRSVEHGGLPGVQQALEILAPFTRACETKYAKLACIAISAFQKLLANDAVSIRGRYEIIKALHAAERLSDESVKLRILQASLTIIQSPSFADEEDAIQQLLSLTFRLYVNNKSNFAVHSTAAATIRQAVALVFDHSILPSQAPAATLQPTAGSPVIGSSPQPSVSPAAPLQSGQPAVGANSPGPPPQAVVGSVTPSIGGNAAAKATSSNNSRALGREAVPLLLLEEMMGWLGARDGKELGWIQLQQQRSANRVDRTFLLEMLEAVLLQRTAAIHRLPELVQCVKAKVAPAVHGLLDSACDRLVDPNDAVDCRLVVRCAAALVRRHHDLAPERAAAMVVRLAETAGSVGRTGAANRWQRFMALQALRPLLADPSLLYRLYHLSLPADKSLPVGITLAATAATGKPFVTKASSGGGSTAVTNDEAAGGSGGGVVTLVVQYLHDALRWYVRTSIETPEDDVVAALGNLYLQRALGARDSVQETEAFGTNLAHGSEVVIAHLALEGVLALVAATEALTDVVVLPAEPGMPSPKLIARDTVEVRVAAVAGLVSELWRCVLFVCNTLLARAAHEVLVQLLVRGMQGVTYSAGALGVIDARDSLLHALCAHTLLPPGEDDVAALVVPSAAAAAVPGTGTGGASSTNAASLYGGDDRSVGSSSRRLAVTPSSSSVAAATAAVAVASSCASSPPPPAPGFLTALLVDRSTTSVRVVLTPRNTSALRALFNLAHRLADELGSSGWLYVVDAVNALDRILASPHTTTANYFLETGGEGEIVAGLQSMNSTGMGPAGGGLPTSGGAGGGTGISGGAAAGTAAANAAMAALPAGDSGTDDSSTLPQRELRILASAADQLFENTHHMSPEAVVSLLSALAEISHRTLSGLGLLGGTAASASAVVTAAASSVMPSLNPGGAPMVVASTAATTGSGPASATAGSGGGPAAVQPAAVTPSVSVSVRLCALNRMVDTLLHNLWRVQDLWGIFLAHVLEVLDSNIPKVRAAAVDALDRTITSALNPDLHVPDKFTAPLPALEDALSPILTATSRRAMTTPAPPYSSGTTPSGAIPPVSRRTSRDMSAGFGEVATSLPFSLHPSSDLPSPLVGNQCHQPNLASPIPLAAPTWSPFVHSTATATTAAATTSCPAPPPAATITPAVVITNRGVQQSAQQEDVQHMLLVALDSLYREGGRSPDVRHGLLRVALHVLQHHGDGLTRGWVPLLRLLEAVPRAGQGPVDVRLGFQVVELLATDYLSSSLPKEHVAKALDVIARFATQDAVLNVSLSAITMLWNVTDHLARSRGTFSRAASAAQHQQQPQQQASKVVAEAVVGTPAPAPRPTSQKAAVSPGPYNTSSSFGNMLYGSDTSASAGEKQMSPAFAAALSFARGVPSLPSASSPERSPWGQMQSQQPLVDKPEPPAPAPAPAQSGHPAPVGGGLSYPLHDLDEAESIAMLMIAFRSLKLLSVDPRPEARNSAVRTLFLAVGSHGGKFPPATWQELFWSLLFDLLLTIHRVSANSSVEEAAAVELGKEKGGRSVVMLVHHSRNSEKKQWDETLVLALGGAAKVIRSYLAVLSTLDVWTSAWEQLMQVLGELLASCHKGVCLASTSLLTTVLQSHGSGPLVSKSMWQQALAALDQGVNAMARPNTSAPLQARAELLSCITTLSSQLLLRGTQRPGGEAPSTVASNGGISHVESTPFSSTASSEGADPDPEHLLLVLRWLDRFARYPVGGEDTAYIHFTTIGPIQKAVLAALAALPPVVAAAGVWPVVLGLLCNMLRPFGTLALRQYAQQAAAVLQQRKASSPTPWFTAAAVEAAPQQPPVCITPTLPVTSNSLESMSSVTSTATVTSSCEVSVHNPPDNGIASSPGSVPGSSLPVGGSNLWLTVAGCNEVMEARAMSPLWMAHLVELLASWYRDHMTWQVRVATFPLMVGAMSECMACRHLLPQPGAMAGAVGSPSPGHSQFPAGPQLQLAPGGDYPGEAQALEELWRTAARGFVTVVQSGLPSINICSHQGHQVPQPQVAVPHSTWPALARAFQMFFLAANLPPLQQPPPDAQHGLTLAAASASASTATLRRLSVEPQLTAMQPSSEQASVDREITTAVLDCLSETVLSACQHAPIEMRRALIEVLDVGAGSAAAPSAAGICSGVRPYDESGVPHTSRLSYVCLNKLYVLCSRGQEAPTVDGRELGSQQPAARAQLEVAQLALPVFVSRCEAVLTEIACEDQRTATFVTSMHKPAMTPHGTAAAADIIGANEMQAAMVLPPLRTAPIATLEATSPALHDKARHILELLQQLRVVPPVSDSLLPFRPHLRFWLDAHRAVQKQTTMPQPSLAACAAAAAAASAAASHPPPSLQAAASSGGSPAVLLKPPAASRCSSSGVDLGSPNGAGGGGALPPTELSFSNCGPMGRTASPSFFSRTYSSTGALLSSALGVATTAAASGSGNSNAGAAGVPAANTPSKRASGSSGGGGLPPDARSPFQGPPRGLSNALGSGVAVSGCGMSAGDGLLLANKSLWVKEQPHLLALYGVLCECIGSSDPVIRTAVQGMLMALGGGLGLCAVALPAVVQ